MKRAVELSPQHNLVEYLGEILLEGTSNPEDNIVVFPGKRPSHFLRKFLSQRIKRPFRAPYIFSMDEFVDFLYESLGYSDKKISAVDGVSLIYSIHSENPLITGKNALSLDEFLPWGFKIFSDLEELYIEFVNPQKLREVDLFWGEKIPEKVRKKLISLSQLYSIFYGELEKRGVSTRSLRYRRVAEEIESIKFEKYNNVVIAGFFALTESERKIFENLKTRRNSVFIFQEGPHIEEIYRTLSLNPERIDTPQIHRTEYNFYRSADVHGEIFALGELLKAKPVSIRDVIVLPSSDTLFPILQNVIPVAQGKYNISMGYPVHRTPLHSLLEVLGKVLETKLDSLYFVPAYLKFVLHPYIKNIYLHGESTPTRIIFHTIEEYLVEKNRRLIELTELEEDSDLLDSFQRKICPLYPEITEQELKEHLKKIHRETLKKFEVISNIRDFCKKLLDLISFISRESPANLHPFSGEFFRRTLESIHDLASSGFGEEKFENVRSYFILIRNYLRTVSVPFEGTPLNGLQVLGFLETRNLKFENVYFLDLNEGILPNVSKEDTILPSLLRQHLKLPDYRDRQKIAEYYFYTLTRGAKKVHLFYVENAQREKSRFIERLIWEIQKEKKTLKEPAPRDIIFRVNFACREVTEIQKGQDITEFLKKVPYSPTMLDTYLRCPLRFYYTYVIGLGEKEGISEEIESREIGRLVHEILELFFADKLGRKLVIERDDRERMDTVVEKVFEEHYPGVKEARVIIIKRTIKKRMRELLDYCKKSQEDIVILHLEKEYTGYMETNDGTRVALSGRVDRVERRGDTIYIIDYKTGSSVGTPNPDFKDSPREEWYKKLKSVQLPLYINLYMQNHQNAKIEKLNSSLLLLREKDFKEEPLFYEEDESKKKIAMDLYMKAVKTLIEEILDSSIPFTPTVNPKEHCQNCPFKIICGKQWIRRSKW